VRRRRGLRESSGGGRGYERELKAQISRTDYDFFGVITFNRTFYLEPPSNPKVDAEQKYQRKNPLSTSEGGTNKEVFVARWSRK